MEGRTIAVWLMTLAALALVLGGCKKTSSDDDDDDTGHHCLEEGATNCVDGAYVECVDGAWVVIEECDLVCDPQMGCLICEPNEDYCEGDLAMHCEANGLSATEIMDCAEWDTTCENGECVFEDPCIEAEAWQSSMGCMYWAADLDNSENSIDDAAGAMFAVVVANVRDDLTATVKVEMNLAYQGEPLDLWEVDEVEVDPGQLHIFYLPRRDVDGVNMVFHIDDGPQSWLSSRAFRITSDVPIVAYQFNPIDQQFSNDASLLLPQSGLGQDHLVVTYIPSNPMEINLPMMPAILNRTYVTIIGTKPNTSVQVTPTYDIFFGEGDCDDANFWRYPTAPEYCDGIDNDCDNEVPEDEVDADGDGVMACANDCDDADPTVYDGAPERCDNIDQDCDGDTDDQDDDTDNDGMTPCQGDCDDTDAATYTGATEICDGKDNDCDGAVPANELDVDGDGYLACAECNDADATVHPGANELCDAIDQNCDGQEGGDLDADSDGQTPCGGDCDDTDPNTYTGATELCDMIDNDCSGAPAPDEVDADGDGSPQCADCNDGWDQAYPGAPELCDDLDNNCDGAPHDTTDHDGDGFPPCTGVDAIVGDEVALPAGNTRSWIIGEFDVLNLETVMMKNFLDPLPDLTGTVIKSDQPVVVFTGVDMSSVVVPPPDPPPKGYNPCCAEHIEQQVIPSKSMADHFVVTRSATRNWESPEPDFYRIMAYANNTSVTTSLPAPNDQFALGGGQYAEFYVNHGFVVEADKPLHVAQFLVVGSDAGYIGDAALMYIPAVEQRRNFYVFTTGEGFAENHAVFSMPQGTTVYLDGNEVTDVSCMGPWIDGVIDGVTYESYSCEIQDGAHAAYSEDLMGEPGEVFGVSVYGYYNAGSYAYPAGSDLRTTNDLSEN